MEIRRLTPNDYEQMAMLWSRAKLPFKPKGRDNRDAVVAQMKANPEFFLGAFEAESLAGVVVLSCDMRKGWINRWQLIQTIGIAELPKI